VSKLRLDQSLRRRPAGAKQLPAQPADHDVEGATAHLIAAVEKLVDLRSRAEGPRFREKMREEAAFGARECQHRPVLGHEDIALCLKAQSGERKIDGSLISKRSSAAGDSKDSLNRLIEGEDIDWGGNTVGGTGDLVFFHRWMRRIANDKDRDGRALAYGQDRVGARVRRTAKIENDDIRLAVTDQIEKTALHRIGVISRWQSAFRRARD
jgi:hypothetical protein